MDLGTIKRKVRDEGYKDNTGSLKYDNFYVASKTLDYDTSLFIKGFFADRKKKSFGQIRMIAQRCPRFPLSYIQFKARAKDDIQKIFTSLFNTPLRADILDEMKTATMEGAELNLPAIKSMRQVQESRFAMQFREETLML